MKKIFGEATLLTDHEIICPHHLFAAVCQPGYEIGNELFLYLYQNLGKDFLMRVLSINNDSSEYDYSIVEDQKISSTTLQVLEEAKKEMEKYHQSLLGIGHIVKALLDHD